MYSKCVLLNNVILKFVFMKKVTFFSKFKCSDAKSCPATKQSFGKPWPHLMCFLVRQAVKHECVCASVPTLFRRFHNFEAALFS